MKYYYDCPNCGSERSIEWAERNKNWTCGKCKKPYSPPKVSDDHNAYVDEREWPEEMEDEIKSLHGEKCIVPWCNEDADTIDHIDAWENGGKTSVNNGQPMCQAHNSSKGTKEYRAWLKEIENDPDLGKK